MHSITYLDLDPSTYKSGNAAAGCLLFANINKNRLATSPSLKTSEEVMQEELWIDKPIDKTVMHYAKNTMEAGLDGVVCSPLEAGKVHEVCGEKFLTITPGVRFADGDVGDQKRVTTPAKAKELGSDYIVVGRPITQAADPVAAYRRCVAEFVG